LALEVQDGTALALYSCVAGKLIPRIFEINILRGGWSAVKNLKKVAVLAGLTLAFSGLASSQVAFSVVKIPGANPNSLIAINNNGQVMVNTGKADAYKVATWGLASDTEGLALPVTNGGGASISDTAAIAGTGDPDSSGIFQAFVWQPGTGVQWLGSLGGELSAASGVNDAGNVVGYSYNAAYSQHAFLWTRAGGMQDLTPSLTNTSGGTAVAINTLNQVVGYYFPDGADNTLGFLWTQANGFQSLGVPGTLAFAINDSQMIVGQSLFVNGNAHAFSWTPTTGVKDLGTLGGSESSALSVNNKGWIVGTSMTTSTKNMLHGFLWTPTAGMQDFMTVAGLSSGVQPYSVQVNDYGVIAISSNTGGEVLVPKMMGTITSSANPSVLGNKVTFTATISSIAGPPPDGETVEFVAGGVTLGSAPLKGGVAQFTTSALAVGSHAIVADYNGDANYLAAKYTALTQKVVK
jgi:probable HAF family extracellular repeat protein